LKKPSRSNRNRKPGNRADARQAQQGRYGLICTWLRFWKFCRKPLCRRELACRGDSYACFRLHWDLLPEEFKIRLRFAIEFMRSGMSAVEASKAAAAKTAALARSAPVETKPAAGRVD
jgi:hypothetical protein